jgi:hypothetical protein
MILNGIYSLENLPDVHLIELSIDQSPEKVDVGAITQELEETSSGSLQSPWDEKYLDADGTKVIGDWADIPKGQSHTRLLFFFHFLNLQKPLMTQFGPLTLTTPTPIPDRLNGLVHYESPD